MENYFPARLIVVLFLALVAGCGEQGPREHSKLQVPDLDIPAIRAALSQLHDDRNRHLSTSIATARDLQSAVGSFLVRPDTTRLEEARATWIKAHHAWLAAGFLPQHDAGMATDRIDAWPMEEGFLDSLPAYPHSGIIRDVTIPITEQSLRRQHGITDRREVSLGFHPLEFLLFSRSVSDFEDREEPALQRRRKTLELIAGMLVREISSFRLPYDGRTREESAPTREHLSRILHALGERIRSLISEADYLQDEHPVGNPIGNPIGNPDRNPSRPRGHSRFSGTSGPNLQVQIDVLIEMTGHGTGLSGLLQQVDPKTAGNYQSTLLETRNVLSQRDRDNGRLRLLLSALGHQMDDLVTALTNGRRPPDPAPSQP